MIRLAPAVLLLLVSCGYRIGGLYEDYQAGVRVDIFDNQTERRTNEFDLTSTVTREMASRGLRVNVPGAPYALRGRIRDLRTPSVVEGETDAVLVGSLYLLLEIELVNAQGDRLWSDRKAETAAFAASRGETFETARREAFDRLARWVVTHFEKEW